MLQPSVDLAHRSEILDGLNDVVDRLTLHVKSVDGNVDFVRKQIKAASFVCTVAVLYLKTAPI